MVYNELWRKADILLSIRISKGEGDTLFYFYMNNCFIE